MKSSPAQRRRTAALGAALVLALAALLPSAAGAHWLKPEEIIAGLRQNTPLRERTGIVDVRTDPKLPRLLLIKVRSETWNQLPAGQRLALAQDWYDTWHHNVDQGIVGVVDVNTEKSLVHYDGMGKAQLSP